MDARDLAVVVLAGGVALAMVALAIGAVVHSRAISISEATLLGTVLGASIGALATYVGVRSRDWPPPPPR